MTSNYKFLTAEWRNLLMLNYEIDPAVLQPYVPPNTELDTWQGKTFVSLVGFMFLNTKLLGLPIPFHTDFEEVNLRFYVRHLGPEGWRRGVVFIKEIVPRWAIATVARVVYNENYIAVPMRHTLERTAQQVSAEYAWQFHDQWYQLQCKTQGALMALESGSDAEFITEHYWGYAAQRGGGTVEYQVEHPRWRLWQGGECAFSGDVAALYGAAFAPALQAASSSAFLAEGSAIVVRQGVRI